MNIIISGASKGIGKALAMRFASNTNKLILCARSMNLLQNIEIEIKQLFPQAIIYLYKTDLSQKENAIAFGHFCLSTFNPDVLINNVGHYSPGNVVDQSDEILESMMNINFYSAYYLTRAIVPSMIERRSGHIFNNCSVAALKAYEGGGGYSISKFALNGFSQNLRHELKTKGVKVTTLFSGAVLTESWGNYDNSNKRMMEASDIAETIYAATQLSEQAVVEEIFIRPQLGDL